jgi:NAD+ synthase
MYQKIEKLPEIDEERAVKIIVDFIKIKSIESRTNGLVLGLSGGIDSSTVAHLCSRSLDNDKILGLIMPDKKTDPKEVDDAKNVAKRLGIEYEILFIDKLFEPFSGICPHSNNDMIAIANLKARTRMMILYYHSNSMNRLVVGTGNRTELLVGYFTKYGDGGVDILPIGDLFKTQVKQLADYIGVPKNVINKTPSAGLWAGQTDEEELGIGYGLLDQILYCLIEQKLSERDIAENLQISLNEILRVKNMVKLSEHKILSPYIVKVR